MARQYGFEPSSKRDPLAERAFDLGEAWDARGRIRADAEESLVDPFALARGEQVPTEPIAFARAEGRRLLDLVGTTDAVLDLVSPSFVEALERHGFTGWATFPVRLDLGRKTEAASGYVGLSVTGRCGPIDDALSERVTIPPPVPRGEALPGLKGLYFARGTWDGSDVFTPEDRAAIFVTPEVKEALEEAGMTGIEFRRLSEIERPLLDDD